MPPKGIKGKIEKELLRPGGIDPRADHSKSNGPLHDRQHERGTSTRDDDLALNLPDMDDAAFKKFADRLAVLKGIKGQPK